MVGEEARVETATAITAYGITLATAAFLKYLCRFLLASDNDWLLMVRNLRRVQQKWLRLSRVLGR